MNKIITLALVGSALFGVAGQALAYTSHCGANIETISTLVQDPITLVWTSVETEVDHGFLACDSQDPMKVNQAWGLDGYHTPQIKAGATIVDEAGIKDTCPIWYSTGYSGNACFDISHTDMYRAQARATAKQMQSNGFIKSFGNYSYWLNN